MSEPQVDAPSTSFLLDGDAPRLGGGAPGGSTPHDATPVPPSTPMPPPVGPSHHQRPSPVFSAAGPAPLLGSAELDGRPAVADHPAPALPGLPTNDATSPAPEASSDPDARTPPLPTPEAPANGSFTDIPTAPAASPTLPSAGAPTDAPTLPSSAPATAVATATETGDEPGSTDGPAAAAHPMGHLMPQKSAPSEASKRAAEIRAAKRAKARKVKIGVAVGALVVAALAGPPIFGWVSDAINEAGSTDVEE